MSRENVDLLERFFEAGAADDTDALLPFLPEDVVWHPPRGWIEASEYRGHAGAREAMEVFTEHFEDYHVEVDQLIDTGDKVVALLHQVGRPRGSEQEFRHPWAAVQGDFRPDGTIGETWFFTTSAEALEFAGLES